MGFRMRMALFWGHQVPVKTFNLVPHLLLHGIDVNSFFAVCKLGMGFVLLLGSLTGYLLLNPLKKCRKRT